MVTLGYEHYSCDTMCCNAIPEVLSQNDASWNGAPERFFLGMDITKTSSCLTEFRVTMRSTTSYI
jgi:hypothetical protein